MPNNVKKCRAGGCMVCQMFNLITSSQCQKVGFFRKTLGYRYGQTLELVYSIPGCLQIALHGSYCPFYIHFFHHIKWYEQILVCNLHIFQGASFCPVLTICTFLPCTVINLLKDFMDYKCCVNIAISYQHILPHDISGSSSLQVVGQPSLIV